MNLIIINIVFNRNKNLCTHLHMLVQLVILIEAKQKLIMKWHIYSFIHYFITTEFNWMIIQQIHIHITTTISPIKCIVHGKSHQKSFHRDIPISENSVEEINQSQKLFGRVPSQQILRYTLLYFVTERQNRHTHWIFCFHKMLWDHSCLRY